MAAKRATRAVSSIDKALAHLSKTESSAYRKVEKSLTALKKKHLSLVEAFQQRAKGRQTEASRLKAKTIASAETALAQQRTRTEQYRRIGDESITDQAEKVLKTAELQVEIAKASGKWHESIAELETTVDDELFNWLDELTSRAVQSLFHDDAVDKTITMISGGVIAAGLIPTSALIAAVTSAAILARDIKTKFTRKGRITTADSALVRIETASRLIDYATKLTDDWLRIFQARGHDVYPPTQRLA